MVLGDSGRPLKETEQLCRELNARRNILRTHLVVLTERAPEERVSCLRRLAVLAAAPGLASS